MTKRKEFGLTPVAVEAAYIQYLLKVSGWTATAVSDELGVCRASVSNVITGRRHSSRIELRIAQLVGFSSWNALILSIRKDGANGCRLPAA